MAEKINKLENENKILHKEINVLNENIKSFQLEKITNAKNENENLDKKIDILNKNLYSYDEKIIN